MSTVQEERLCGIFTLHGVRNESQIKIKHIENVKLKGHEYVGDTLVKKFEIFKGVVGEIYTCNITDAFIMKTRKLPMMYISVIHDKPLRRILLFRVYLCFTILSEIKTSKELLHNKHNGKFSLEIEIDNTRKELNDQLDKYPGDEKLYNKLTDFTLAPEMKDLSKSLVADIDKKLQEEYEKEFAQYKPPTNVISLKNYKLK